MIWCIHFCATFFFNSANAPTSSGGDWGVEERGKVKHPWRGGAEMVRFRAYFENMVASKPEWRKASIDYATLHALLDEIKKGLRLVKGEGGSLVIEDVEKAVSEENEEEVFAARRAQSEGKPWADQFHVDAPAPAATAGPTLGSPLLSAKSPDRRPAGPVLSGERRITLEDASNILESVRTLQKNVQQKAVVSGESSGSLPPKVPHSTPTSNLDEAQPSGSNENMLPAHEERGDPLSMSQTANPPQPFSEPPMEVASSINNDEYNSDGTLPRAPMVPQLVVPEGLSREASVVLISEHAANCARRFESLLLSEADKCASFSEMAIERFEAFLDKNEATWKKPSSSKGRTRDNTRYLFNEVGNLSVFVDTNSLAIQTVLRKYLNSHPFAVGDGVCLDRLLPRLDRCQERCTLLRRAVEEVWATVFETGDIGKARQTIGGRMASPRQSFRAGFFLALVISCILYWLHVFLELEPSEPILKRFSHVVPVIRMLVVFTFAFITWSWVLYVLQTRSVNYLYVFELKQTGSATWMQCLEYSLMMFFLAGLAGALHLRSEMTESYYSTGRSQGGFTDFTPYFLPVFVVILSLTIAFPLRHVFRKTRKAFFTAFYQLIILPWGDVRFIHFFIADWGTSASVPLGDFLFTACFFTAEYKIAYGNEANSETCNDVRAKWSFAVALIPFYWRGCQTLRMYLRTKNRVHLINHGKYVANFLALSLQWWYALSPSDSLLTFVWIVRVIAQLYAFMWDILMDWGWIRGSKRGMMFPSKLPYILAGLFDFFGRFFFVPLTIWWQKPLGLHGTLFVQGGLEISRRAMWSIFRVENENLNNLEMYRSVDFVPKVFIPGEVS